MVRTIDAGDQIVTVDRRRGERRDEIGTAAKSDAALPRRKKQRRRQIDPTTCERDYTDDEVVFMHAMDAYKRSSGRMFPTCSEILEVIRSLGYVQANELVECDLSQEDSDACNNKSTDPAVVTE